MDRIIDQKRIEAWKKLEDESKRYNVPILLNLEQLITEDTNIIQLAKSSPLLSYIIAKSSTYLNSIGEPELIFVYNIDNAESKTSYTGYTPTSREIGPFVVTAKKSCLGYARKTIDKLTVFYELIPKPDSPETMKRLFEAIKLLEENESLKGYTIYYRELITCHYQEYLNIIMKESKNSFKRLNDSLDRLRIELSKDPEDS